MALVFLQKHNKTENYLKNNIDKYKFCGKIKRATEER